MRISYLLILCILFSCLSRAQDTIYLSNKTKEVGKVLEIGTSNMSYLKSSSPTGPVFIKTRSEIDSIRYQNGTVDRIRLRSPCIVNSQNKHVFQPIEIDKNRLYYDDKPLSQPHFKKLLLNYPHTDKRTDLMNGFEKMRRYKRRQFTWLIVGPSLAICALAAGVLINTSYENPKQNLIGVAAASGIVLVVSFSVSHSNKNKKVAQKLIVANQYNDF